MEKISEKARARRAQKMTLTSKLAAVLGVEVGLAAIAFTAAAPTRFSSDEKFAFLATRRAWVRGPATPCHV